MRELNLDQLRTLLTIVRLGSFAAAARNLHLAPPTISLHIAELESRLGAKLLIRKRGQVTPSGIGAMLVGRAEALLKAADDAVEEVRRQTLGRSGRVRLGASTGALAHQLPRALEILGKDHPDIDVQVAVLTSQETITRLLTGNLEIGLIALPQSNIAGVKITAWRCDPIMAFVPSAWPSPRIVTPAWLSQHPLILNDNSTKLARLTADWFASAGEQPKPRIELNYNDAIKSLVGAGYGAALLPIESGLVKDPTHSRVKILPLRPTLWRGLAIAHRAEKLEPATLHVLKVLGQLR